MSTEKREKIICPDCGAEIEVTIWESLNADIDPKAKEDLITGKLFDFDCPNCHKHHNLVYPILYHDMAHKVMVEFVMDEGVEKAIEKYEKSQTLLDGIMPSDIRNGYRYRVVTTQNDLHEKVGIFDAGLDDRVIELMKLAVYNKVRADRPNKKIEEIHFYTSDEEHGFAIICEDGSFTLNTAVEFYDSVKQQFSDKLSTIGDKDYLIDSDWVRRKLLE